MAKRGTTVVSFNAHVGLGLINNGLRWVLRKNLRTSLVLIQEGRHVNHLKRNLGPRFKTWPNSQPGADGHEAMTYVAWLRLRYKFIQGWNHDIRHGGQYPRRCTAAVLFDRVRQCYVLVVSLHPDPMGKAWKAPANIVESHQKQMEEYLNLIAKVKTQYPGILIVAGGDTNEVLRANVPDKFRARSAKVGLGNLGLQPLFMGKLDGVWSNKKGSGRAVNVPVKGMDHPATVAQIQ